MNYNFELRKDKINKDGLIPIRMVISHGKIRIRKNIEAKCLLEHWNADSNIIISEKKNKYYDIYQEYNSNIVDAKIRLRIYLNFFNIIRLNSKKIYFSKNLREIRLMWLLIFLRLLMNLSMCLN